MYLSIGLLRLLGPVVIVVKAIKVSGLLELFTAGFRVVTVIKLSELLELILICEF
jgi:hypothetical protein